ncbi:MAG: hypothetical protein AB7W16_23045 [Candidatus Obscuribacterales bacterium]
MATTPTMSDIQTACDAIERAISLKEHKAGTHVVTEVTGLDAMSKEVAVYLYACLSAHIDYSLNIIESLVGTTANARKTLSNDIRSYLIAPEDSDPELFRITERDPWILEGIAHLLMKLSRNLAPLSPPGPIEVMTDLHDDVKGHGLDQVGFFLEGELLSMNIGEAKATEKKIRTRIDDTGKTFEEVKNGVYEPHIRSRVQQLRYALSPNLQQLVTASFWENRQAFIAITGFPEQAGLNISSSRKCYERVGLPEERIRLIAVKLNDYRAFFEQVSLALLALA